VCLLSVRQSVNRAWVLPLGLLLYEMGGVLRVCFALVWEPKSEDQEIENGMEWSG
jgi:hypothetical protein